MIRFVLLIAVAWSASALDPAIAISQYAKKHWQVEDGLPQNYVTSIAQLPDGHLLVGTAGGVARFDGLQFTPLVLDPQSGITREWITSVAATPDGSIWVASRDAGNYLFRGAEVLHRNGRLDSLVALPSMQVAGLGGDGLNTWTLAGLSPISRALTPSDPSWQGLKVLGDGSLLIGARSGLHLVHDGTQTLVTPPESYGPVLALSQSGDWMGTANGLYRLAVEHGKVVRVEPVAGVPGPVVNLLQDRGGTLWAATWGRGIYRVTDRRVDAWTSDDGLPDNFVHNVFEDSEGNLWIGTRAGLSRWKDPRLLTYGLPEGLHGHFVSAVTGDDKGVWFGTWRSGLYRFENEQIRRVNLDVPEMTVLFRALAYAHGKFWVSNWSSLMEQRSGVWRRYSTREFDQAADVLAIAVDREGWLWLGTSNGAFRFQENPRTGTEPVWSARNVRVLSASASGRVWMGSEEGLRVWERGELHHIGGLPNPRVTSISDNGHGTAYVTTRLNGFCVVENLLPRCLDARHGLPAAPLFAVIEAGNTLWMSSPAGIYSASVAQLREVLENRRAVLETFAYTQDDGLRSVEGQNVGYPSGWLDSRGDVWFATVRGIVRARPARSPRLPPPRLVAAHSRTGGENHVVRFAGLRLGSPERVQFRYRIDDDRDWIFAGTERTLRFTNLPAGTHKLHVAARDAGQDWGDSVEVSFIQVPRMHETWWFRLLCAAVLCALMFAIYRWRVALVQLRYRAVLAERNRIAREWHDTLLAGLSAIAWQLDATLHRLRDKPESAAEAVDVARTMVQHCRAEARHVISDLRSEEPELDSLPAILRSSMAEIVKGHDVECSVGVEGDPPSIPGEVAQNVLRICQEAASNAIHHGAAKRIDVRLRFNGNHLVAAVADDGTGFAPETVPAGHFGLAIMKERAKRFGGSLTILSRKGSGTTVTAEIPL